MKKTIQLAVLLVVTGWLAVGPAFAVTFCGERASDCGRCVSCCGEAGNMPMSDSAAMMPAGGRSAASTGCCENECGCVRSAPAGVRLAVPVDPKVTLTISWLSYSVPAVALNLLPEAAAHRLQRFSETTRYLRFQVFRI
jgi:hypothetical protein